MKKSNEFGVSLIEVLISLLLLAVGFLGLASTQILSSQNLNASNERTLATYYVENMADQIRSFQEGLSRAALNGLDGNTDVICETACTSTQLLQNAFVAWNQDIGKSIIEGGLPNGQGSVNYNETDGVFEIKITWMERLQFAVQSDDQVQEYSSRIRI